jgi:hypothetical protein
MANLFRTDFYGWRSVAGLSNVTVRQKFSNHTLFFLDYNVSSNQRFLLPPEDTPFQLRMGNGPLNVRSLYGYVNHMEDRVNEEGERITRVVGIGTSKVMNTASMSSWEGQTRTGIIRDLATRHRLRSVVHSHPEVLGSWSSGGMTDFKVAQTLAEEMGYRLWIDGATLWLLDPQMALASASSMSTRVVKTDQQRAGQVFKGSNVPGQVQASKRTVQYGVDPTTNEVIVSTSGDRSLPVEVLNDPVSSHGEAGYTADSLQRKRQDQASVTMTIEGDMLLTPGAPVRFESTTTHTSQRGLWLINEAVHEVSSSGFTSTLSASRDRDRALLSRVPDVLRREGVLATAVIRNGKTWEANTQERVYA